MNAEANDVASEAPSVDTVKFADGSSIDFVGKRRMIKRTVISGDGVSVSFYFRNGEHRVYDIPPTMMPLFAGHGAEQKIGDAAAGSTNIHDMIEEVDTVLGNLAKGPSGWSTKREGSGFAGQSVLLRALVQVSQKPVERVREYLTKLSQKEKMALRQSPKLKPTIEAIEAQDAASDTSIDTDSLLEAL